MDKCCGNCRKWEESSREELYAEHKSYCLVHSDDPRIGYCNAMVEVPAIFSKGTMIGSLGGTRCPTYEPKITLDKPHRPT